MLNVVQAITKYLMTSPVDFIIDFEQIQLIYLVFL